MNGLTIRPNLEARFLFFVYQNRDESASPNPHTPLSDVAREALLQLTEMESLGHLTVCPKLQSYMRSGPRRGRETSNFPNARKRMELCEEYNALMNNKGTDRAWEHVLASYHGEKYQCRDGNECEYVVRKNEGNEETSDVYHFAVYKHSSPSR